MLSHSVDAEEQTETVSSAEPVVTQSSCCTRPADPAATGADSPGTPAGAKDRLINRFSDIDSYTRAVS